MPLSEQVIKRLATAVFAAVLTIGLASPALAEESTIDQQNPDAISQNAVVSKRALSFEQAKNNAVRLQEGVDYNPNVLLVVLDGQTKMASDGKSVVEYARESIAAQRRHSESSITSSASLIEISSTSLSASIGSEKVGLELLGNMELIAAGNWLDGDVLARVEIPEGMTVNEAIDALLDDDRVLDAFLDGYYKAEAFFPENLTIEVETEDPIYDSDPTSWHLAFASSPGAWSYMMSEISPGSGQEQYGVLTEGDITVAVIDTGCDLDHPDLAGNIDHANARDVVTNAPLTGERATSSHGTHVCGIIAARANNNIGTVGISYNAKILPINAADSGGNFSYGDISDAFDYIFNLIDAGNDSIRVVNMSFGGYEPIPQYLRNQLLSAANDYDLTLVASAGNRGENVAHYPSDYPECISVVSVTKDGKDPYSNYGSGTDICAPGSDIYSTVDGGGYAYNGGTSMAAPIVSGVAALLYAMDPDATSEEVRDALIDGAFDPGAPQFEYFIANGLVSAVDSMELLLFGVDFTDIEVEEWYVTKGYVTYALTNGLMSGYAGTSLFGPEDNMTRAQFATVLYRMAHPNSQATTNPAYYEVDTTGFTDVADYQYYTAAINWAKAQGIMTGDSLTNYTTVRPNQSLNRQEAAVMSQRFAEVLGANVSTAGMSTPSVDDWNDVESWARDAVKWCYHKNVISGWDNGDGTYSALPLAKTQRAMMVKIATILHRDIMP